MAVIFRRLTIITLTMTIFAFVFSALVTAPNERVSRLQAERLTVSL